MVIDDLGDGEVRDAQNLFIRWADNAFPFWNTLANAEVGEDEQRFLSSLQDASNYMKSHKEPGFLWLFEDLVPSTLREKLSHLVSEAGLYLGFNGFGMAADIELSSLNAAHPELEFVRVSTDEHVAAYADLNCRAYDFPSSASLNFSGPTFWTERAYAYLGLRDGVPVTAAATVESNGCLFLILVATAPEHQRKGYGGAITRKAILEGIKATGSQHVTLHATEAGALIYEKMGFKRITPIGFYALNR
ncbi:GNAT family N-acetyltransferase [Pseudomonas matsuisoli]|uniref:N-acetyltransferase domain-containing protein n=1 Tax=Pseudomonas matsuisoli TaxID=1515666 RepID=A0A917Q1W2_9PSED|nr:GNAT family N-acetyltransferase [Pseudomonas matsuisoli]GGK06383.1 hypothetical protein GCM10009304_35640 [Pseudomonas matsuisoli]